MAQQSLQEELQEDYVDRKTKTATVIGVGVGAVSGAGAGLFAGEAGAAVAIGAGVVSAPVVVPAAIGAAAVGAVAYGVSNALAKNAKIEALEKDGLQKEIAGKQTRLLAAMKDIKQLQDQQKEKQWEKNKLLKAKQRTEQNMKKQENTFNQQLKEHGFARNESQIIAVMIGKTGHGKSTLGNRICGDKSRKGNEGPFGASAKKNKAGTTKVISYVTTAPFQKKGDNANVDADEGKDGNNPTDDPDNEENKAPDEIELEIIDLEDIEDAKEDTPSLLMVDTPGWGDVEEANRDDHKNLVVRYLKGCGGINGFVMVISDRDRFDGSIQQMLTEYETLFDSEFWKHLTIVMTGLDDEDDLEEFEEEEHVKDIQQILNDKFKNLRSLNRDIPVVPIGKKTYSTQVPLIMKEIPKQKFTCNALKGPYELLKEKYEKLKRDLAGINHTLDQLKTSIDTQRKATETFKAQINELKAELRKR